MRTALTKTTIVFLFSICTGVFFMTDRVFAHCDTLAGPVVIEAKASLDNGNVTPLLKWVTAEKEMEVINAFNHTLEVRKLGVKAKQLADNYFFETLVRIHRAGEGAPFAGLQPAETIDKAVVLADKSILTGSVEKLAEILSKAAIKGIHDRYSKVMAAQKNMNNSVAQGREYVEAYVQYTHYVEGLHGLIKGSGNHH
tara:strand:- start:39 stop:629 length:591 start_codon:yes stop_codon:yes gene_type:complete